MKKKLRDESGSAMILVALMLVVLMGFAAFAIDMGLVYIQESKLQTACDAAAMGGAMFLPNNVDKAKAEAKEIMKANGYDITDCDIELTSSEGNVSKPDTIKVSKQTEVKTTFASVFNIKSLKPTKSATASIEQEPEGSSGIYSFFSGSDTIPVGLLNSLSIKGGNVHTNSYFDFEGTDSSLIVEMGKITTCDSVKNDENSRDYIADGGIEDNVEYVEMPDYDDSIMAEVTNSATHVYESLEAYCNDKGIDMSGAIVIDEDVKIERLTKDVSSVSKAEVIESKNNPSVKIQADPSSNNAAEISNNITISQGCSLYIVGDGTGDQLEVFYGDVELKNGANIYVVEGRVRFNGGVRLGSGYIVAEGNIFMEKVVQGTQYWYKSAIYSKNGDLVFGATNNVIYGMLYAPKGKMLIGGGYSVHTHGSVVADSIVINGGGSLTIDPWALLGNDKPFAPASSSSSGGAGSTLSKSKLIK